MDWLTTEDILRLLLSVLIGGAIGFEREIHNKAAGLRTITLICLGSTLFTLGSLKAGDNRIVANIVTGIGFLGAGTILFTEGRVKGLTTASAIWVSAAIGVGIGFGHYVLAGTGAIITLLVLWGFARVDRWLNKRGRESRTYELRFQQAAHGASVERLFARHGLRIRTRKLLRSGRSYHGIWEAEGRPPEHEAVVAKLLKSKDILDISY